MKNKVKFSELNLTRSDNNRLTNALNYIVTINFSDCGELLDIINDYLKKSYDPHIGEIKIGLVEQNGSKQVHIVPSLSEDYCKTSHVENEVLVEFKSGETMLFIKSESLLELRVHNSLKWGVPLLLRYHGIEVNSLGWPKPRYYPIQDAEFTVYPDSVILKYKRPITFKDHLRSMLYLGVDDIHEICAAHTYSPEFYRHYLLKDDKEEQNDYITNTYTAPHELDCIVRSAHLDKL